MKDELMQAYVLYNAETDSIYWDTECEMTRDELRWRNSELAKVSDKKLFVPAALCSEE